MKNKNFSLALSGYEKILCKLFLLCWLGISIADNVAILYLHIFDDANLTFQPRTEGGEGFEVQKEIYKYLLVEIICKYFLTLCIIL